MVPMNNCYTFQIVDHLKQSRPGVKNPLVELRPFKDKSLCVVTTLKEYLTRTQSLRGSKSQLFISYTRDLSEELAEKPLVVGLSLF